MKIIPASPYTDISRLKRAAGTVAPTPPRGLPGSGRPAAYQRQAAPENKRWNIIVREAKKRGIRTLTDMKKWAEQELKSGGFLAEYFRREKALGPVRQRAVAQRYAERQRKLRETRAKTAKALGSGYVAPTSKRRDDLRWDVRMRLREVDN